MAEILNPFDGKPSRQLPQRPFFSIVVPCYNPRTWLRDLLNSILAQNMEDEIEVILSDDHSTEDYQDIIEKYNKLLCIRQIKTDYNFAPGNTREKGASIAKGQWLTFIDQDDLFNPNSFPIVKQVLLETGEKYYAISNFYEVDPYNNNAILNEFKQTRNWNHGKFYNVDNLWRKFDLHFKKDLKTHEDIYLSALVNYYLGLINDNKPLYIDLITYIWRAYKTSISRTKYAKRDFLEVFFGDYLESTGEVYYDRMVNGDKKYPEFEFWSKKEEICKTSCMDVLLYLYFYYQGFRSNNPKDYLRENEDLIIDYYRRIKKIFNLDVEVLINTYSSNQCSWYESARQGAKIALGGLIERESFVDFLRRIDKKVSQQI